jgi:hypothetical protein
MGRQRGIQYRPGSFFRADDRSGFVRRADDTQQEWNGLIVGKDLWEERQPQDFVRGVPDIQTVPNPRPSPPPGFYGPVYAQISANVAIGATFIPLNAVNTFTAGNAVGIMLDNGVMFNTAQVGPSTTLGITIAAPMPYTAQSGNDVVNYGSVGP